MGDCGVNVGAWAGDFQSDRNAYESVCVAVCAVWTKCPRVHGWTGCRSLDVWSLYGRQSVSKPSQFQANLQHRNGTGSLWGWVGGRSDGGCVTSEWPLERQGVLLGGARLACVEGEGAKGRRVDWQMADGMNGRDGNCNCIQSELDLDSIAAAPPRAGEAPVLVWG